MLYHRCGNAWLSLSVSFVAVGMPSRINLFSFLGERTFLFALRVFVCIPFRVGRIVFLDQGDRIGGMGGKRMASLLVRAVKARPPELYLWCNHHATHGAGALYACRELVAVLYRLWHLDDVGALRALVLVQGHKGCPAGGLAFLESCLFESRC